MLRQTNRFNNGSCDQLIGVGVGLGEGDAVGEAVAAGEGEGSCARLTFCAREETVAMASTHTKAMSTATAEIDRNLLFMWGRCPLWIRLLEEIGA